MKGKVVTLGGDVMCRPIALDSAYQKTHPQTLTTTVSVGSLTRTRLQHIFGGGVQVTHVECQDSTQLLWLYFRVLRD